MGMEFILYGEQVPDFRVGTRLRRSCEGTPMRECDTLALVVSGTQQSEAV